MLQIFVPLQYSRNFVLSTFQSILHIALDVLDLSIYYIAFFIDFFVGKEEILSYGYLLVKSSLFR